jgi:hypothetical protein
MRQGALAVADCIVHGGMAACSVQGYNSYARCPSDGTEQWIWASIPTRAPLHAHRSSLSPPIRLAWPPLQLLMALDHPNIVRCSACFVNPTKVCIVLDYCSEGEPLSIPQPSPHRKAAPTWLQPCHHAAVHSKQT